MPRGLSSLLLLILLAAGLRAGVLWKYGGLLEEDRDSYRAIAAGLLAGRGYADPQTGEPTAYRPPLYPLFVAAVLGVGGGNLGIGVLQLFLGTMTVVLTYAIGRALGWQRRATLAALLVACDPLLLHNTALVMTETTAAYLATLLILLLLMAPAEGEAFEFTSLGSVLLSWRPLVVGMVFGLCCLCRPTFWAWGVLLAINWLVASLLDPAQPLNAEDDFPQPLDGIFHPSGLRPEGEAAGRAQVTALNQRGWRTRSAPWKVAAGIACVVLPWSVRNMLAMGAPIVTTTHGGYTLLLPHNPVYYRDVVEQGVGTVWDAKSHREWLDEVKAEMASENPARRVSELSPEGERARDQWMSQSAWRTIWNDPVMTLRSSVTLLARLWNVVPLGDQASSVPSGVVWGIGIYYGIVFLLLLAGLIATIGDWPTWAPLSLLIVSVTAVHTLYWADMRMRAPLVPAIALLAVAGMSRITVKRLFGAGRASESVSESRSRRAVELESPIPPV